MLNLQSMLYVLCTFLLFNLKIFLCWEPPCYGCQPPLFDSNLVSTELVLGTYEICQYTLAHIYFYLPYGTWMGWDTVTDWVHYSLYWERTIGPIEGFSIQNSKGEYLTILSAEDTGWELFIFIQNDLGYPEEEWDMFTLTYPNWKNPEIPQTVEFEGELLYDYRSMYMVNPDNWITFIGLTIPNENLTITVDNDRCGEFTDYHFKVKMNLTAHFNASIQVTFPYLDQEGLESYYPLDSNEKVLPNCTIDDAVGFNASTPCLFINYTVLNLTTPYNSKQFLTKEIEFTLKNISNPVYPRPQQGFKIDFVHFLGHAYHFTKWQSLTCNTVLGLTALSVQFDTPMINTKTMIMFTFKTPHFKPKTAMIDLIFPDELEVVPSMITSIIGITNSESQLNYSIEGQTVHITNLFAKRTYSKKEIHAFKLGYLKAPPSTKPITSLKFKIYDNSTDDKYLMYELTKETNFKASPGIFQEVYFEQVNKEINQLTELKVSFTPNDPLPQDSYLKIVLPDELTASNRNSEICSERTDTTGVNRNTIKCTVEDNKTILITNLFQSPIEEGTKIEFYIKNIQNYNKVMQSGNIKLYSYTNDGYEIDVNLSGHYVNFVEGNLLNAVIGGTFENNQNTSILFDITVKNPIPDNGNLAIQFPDEIQLESPLSCTAMSHSFTISTCTITSDNTVLFTSLSAINSNDQITVTISPITTPRSFKPTSSFLIYSLTNDNYKLDKNYGELILANTINKEISTLEITPVSYVTMENTRYKFEFISTNILYHGDIITITFPSSCSFDSDKYEITVNGEGNLSYSQVINSITSTDEGLMLEVKLQFKDETYKTQIGENIVLRVNNIINPSTTKPTETFAFDIKTSEGYAIEEYKQNIVVTMTNGHSFASSLIEAELPSINTVSDYLFDISTYRNANADDTIEITVPDGISFENDECLLEAVQTENLYTLNDNTQCTLDSSKKTVTITNPFSAIDNLPSIISYRFKVKNLRNTISTGSSFDSFKVYLYNNEHYIKEQETTNLTLQFNCQSPCAKCTDVSDYCTKCLISSGKPYILNGICYDKCPSGYGLYENTKECVKCDESCEECDGEFPDKCTKCKPNFPYFNPSTSKCINQCPDGFYADSNSLCQQCDSKCATCKTSSDMCTSCNKDSSLSYLYNNNCLTECPNGTINTDKICFDCDPSCKTCEGTVNSCTSCNSPLLLYKSKCIQRDECSSDMNRYKDTINNKCLDCVEGCKICGTSSTQCYECQEGYVLKNDKCYQKMTSCEEGYFLTSDNLCEPCDSTKCKSCVSTATTCTSCVGSLLLQSNTCVSTCSAGYFPNENRCFNCDPTCESCSSYSQCDTCKSNLVLLDGRCIQQNECDNKEGYFTSSSNDMLLCKKCQTENCSKCSSENKCTLCSLNFYVFNGNCIGDCPTGYKADEASRTCLKSNVIIEESKLNLKPKYLYNNPSDYYTILVLCAVGAIAISIQKKYNKEMLYLASMIPYLSLMFKIVLILLFVYTFYTGMTELFITFAVLLIAHSFFNYVYITIYSLYTSKDEEFAYWRSSNKVSFILYLVFMFLFDYKTVRMYYSRVTHDNFFNAKFKNFKSVHSPYKFSAFLDMILIHITSISICAYIIITYKSYTFPFFLSIYLIVISVFLCVCIIFDMILVPDLNVDFYNQKKPKPDVLPNNVNDKPLGISGIIEREGEGYNKFESPQKERSEEEKNERKDTVRSGSPLVNSNATNREPNVAATPEKKNVVQPFVSFGGNNIDSKQNNEIKKVNLDGSKIEEENSKNMEVNDFNPNENKEKENVKDNSGCFDNEEINDSIKVEVQQ